MLPVTFSYDNLFHLFEESFIITLGPIEYTLNKGNHDYTILYHVKRIINEEITHYYEFISEKFDFHTQYNQRMYEILTKDIQEDKLHFLLKDSTPENSIL